MGGQCFEDILRAACRPCSSIFRAGVCAWLRPRSPGAHYSHEYRTTTVHHLQFLHEAHPTHKLRIIFVFFEQLTYWYIDCKFSLTQLLNNKAMFFLFRVTVSCTVGPLPHCKLFSYLIVR